MARIPVMPPFNLQARINRYLPQSLGAIGNKEVFKGADFIFQIIKGPNARKHSHKDPTLVISDPAQQSTLLREEDNC